MLRGAIAALGSLPEESWSREILGDLSVDTGWVCSVFLLGRAGEPIRPLLLAKRAKLPLADIFGIWVLERLFDVASMAVIAAIALLVFNGAQHTGDAAITIAKAARTAGSVLAIGVGGAIAFLIYLRVHGTALLEARLQGWLSECELAQYSCKNNFGFYHRHSDCEVRR